RQQGRAIAETASRLEERRQVTVLFCELHVVNVSDPEEAMERLVTPQALCEEMVHAQGGHMVQAHGGGLLAYFGYPLALEHSAICGLRAARRMAVLTAPGLEVRVGVHQGFIVTGGDPNLPDPIGMTSNVAIQLRALAEVGEVLASGEVCRSAATYFAFVPVGQRRLRRMAGAVEVFQVGDESGVRHRLEAATKLTPLVGREAELRVLEQAWGQAHGGKFAALLISGEPGMGKSRLVREWTDRVANGENTVYELRCFSETRHSPWHPVIEAYQTMAGICAADGPEVKLDKLHALFRRRVPTLANRALPLLARLLDVPMEGVASSAEPLDKELPRLLVDLLLAIAARNPVLFVLEDAHWADESTLAFLSQLCSRTKDAAICLLVTTRPEFQPDWPNLDQLALSPLDDAAVCAIVRAVCGDMPTASMENIVARADGIPLYAEELAALAQEEDLPSNLLDLLTARLDALGGARAVAQLSACVGREIDEDFLGMISDMPASARRDAITRLLSSGLMQRLEDRRLQFKHTLVQEAAYKSQTKAARSAAHRRIAQVLEDGYGDLKTQQPEILARHWSAAGETKIAMGHWLAAGRHAAWNYAFPEAANHYTEGLALLPKLAQGADRDKLEFSLLINLARVEQMLSGYGHDRVMATMERALALLEMGVGDGIDRFHALWGLWEAAGSKQGHEEALRIARQMQTLAENENDRALWQQALYAVGNSLFWTGNLPLARSELERLIALENASDDGAVRDFYGRNVLSAARGYLAWILWLQGDTAQALTLCDEVLSLTKRLGVPFDQAFAYVFAVVLQRWQGNTEAVARLAEEGLCRAMACQSLPLMVAMKVHQAWTVVMDGDASALAPIEQAINAGIQSLSGGAMIVLPPFVDMLLAVGEVDKAQSIIEKALQHSQQKQDRHYLPELHRLQGECLVRQGDNKTARASFETAIKVGQKQGAMAFVRRAEQSLGRLMSG
ncbi:MAG TPA: AAA family ATPase, partial [Rhodocyclaceae bacterium]|nr:AAA family ATPase [Rhodocyclaceae bacterium]